MEQRFPQSSSWRGELAFAHSVAQSGSEHSGKPQQKPQRPKPNNEHVL